MSVVVLQNMQGLHDDSPRVHDMQADMQDLRHQATRTWDLHFLSYRPRVGQYIMNALTDVRFRRSSNL